MSKKNCRKQENREEKKWSIDSVHDTEVVRSFKYLGTVINNTNNETEIAKAGIVATNKACYFLQVIFRSKQIHRNNKTRSGHYCIIELLSEPRHKWQNICYVHSKGKY
jgi:hypothetical protein